MKYDVFISYSRKDFDEVSSILESLKMAIPGLTYWFDITGIESGDEFEEKIIAAIDNSTYVLFALSENSIQSKWTKDEVMYAKNTDKKVIPVLLKGAQMKGWFLFKFGRVDCIDSTNSLQLDKLIHNLASWTAKPIAENKSTQLSGNDSAKPSVDMTSTPKNQQGTLCPCGSGKLFKDCHGKTSTTPPVDMQTKVTPRSAIYDQNIEDAMSTIIKTLSAYKITVACITANVQSNGVMYKITPGPGTKPYAIANLYREIALALRVKEVTATPYADGVALVVPK